MASVIHTFFSDLQISFLRRPEDVKMHYMNMSATQTKAEEGWSEKVNSYMFARCPPYGAYMYATCPLHPLSFQCFKKRKILKRFITFSPEILV